MNPTEKEIEEFIKMGENAPHTTVISKEQQNEILNEIKNSEITPLENEEPPKHYDNVSGVEVCPHCDNEFNFDVPENIHTDVCPYCGKVIPLCDKCTSRNDERACENCIYCDVANLYNCLRKNITIKQFLAKLNPSLKDLTTVAEGSMFTPSYDAFVNDEGGDGVSWDYKYWSIYGKIVNSMLSADSTEDEVVSFVKEIIADNLKH